jgi:hypothetical protein
MEKFIGNRSVQVWKKCVLGPEIKEHSGPKIEKV